MRRAALGALMVLTCQVGAGCIFGQDENVMPKPSPDMQQMKDMGGMEDLAPPGPDMTTPGCAPANEGELCCGDLIVNINEDPEHCGACGVSCGEGNTCVQGACTCDKGALPRVVAKDIPANSRIFLVPSLASERLLPERPDASSFEDVFRADLELLTYYAVTYEPDQSVVRVLGLNGRGEAMPGMDSKLNPRPSSTRLTIKTIVLNQDFMGNLVMFIHFDDMLGSSELRSYRVRRSSEGGFTLQQAQGELINVPGSKIYAIGTNKNVLEGIAVVYVTDTAEGAVIAGSVIDPKGAALIEPISLGRTVRWPEGTELQVGLSDDVLAVSWWKPTILDGSLQEKGGDFEQVLFARDGDRYKSFRGPEKIGDTVYLGRGLELPRSQPMFLFNKDKRDNWAYYQITQALGASTVEIWSSLSGPAQEIAQPALAFGQDWSLQLKDLLYLEFSWVEGESLDQMPLTGGLHYASWGLDLTEKLPPKLRSPSPLSADKKGYRNVRTAFGAPRTMGYLGLYAPNNMPGELHFYMTYDDERVCLPERFRLNNAP